MATLKCGIVGVPGNTFSINIDSNKSVDDLKVAIKQKNAAAIACDAKDLQLFIAKKDGLWLTERDLMDGLTDVSGMTQLEDAELREVGFSEEDLRVQLTEQDMAEGKSPGHVLVRIPESSEAKASTVAKPFKPAPQTKVAVGDKRRRTTPDTPALIDDLYSLTTFVQLRGSKSYLAEGTVLKLPTVVCGKEFSNTLFIRSEYPELHKIIKRKLQAEPHLRRILVVGSPGIGMTEFGVFLLLVFAMEKRDIAYRPLGRMSPYYLSWNSTKGYYNISEIPLPGKKYEGLFDGSEAGGALENDHFRHAFVLASLHTENYKNFVKDSCFTVYMNPWTKGECQSFVDGIQLNEDEWYHRFNLIGGKPRLLFSDEEFDDLVQRVKDAIPENIEGLMEQVRFFHMQVFDDRMKHILFHIYRDDNEPSRGILSTASLIGEGFIGDRYNLPVRANYSLLEILAQNL